MKNTNSLTMRMENILATGLEADVTEFNGDMLVIRSVYGGRIMIEGFSCADSMGEAGIKKFKFFGGADAESESFEGLTFVKAERLGRGKIWISL